MRPARLRAIVLSGLSVMALFVSAPPAAAQLSALVSPGKLARPHAALEGIANCSKCHEQGQRVTAQKCLACHAPVRDRIAKKAGVHKHVTTDCVTCHAEHAGVDGELRPFDQRKFDHAAVTGFALDGKHAAAAADCSGCHKARSFLAASPACASCHTDVHKGSLGKNCESCHSARVPFKQLGGRFDHAKVAFPLTGAHKSVACAGCHVNGAFKGVRFASCSDCHRDPHAQKLGAACATCHTPDSWRTRKFDHAKTAFPLVAQHSAVPCASCHKQSAVQVKLKADTCATCHVDPHRGTFKQDCKACHSEAGWSRGSFDHSRTKFQLTGGHQGLACQKCHTSAPAAPRAAVSRAPAGRGAARGQAAAVVADFRGLKTACVSCHADVHQNELGASCETCHSPASFRLPGYKHARDADFFTGQHAGVACAKCHGTPAPLRAVRTVSSPPVAVRFKNTGTACASCHRDVHLGQIRVACESCHSIQAAKFAVVGFKHATTAFPLTGKHDGLECRACHKPETAGFPAGRGTAVRLQGVARECLGCHADVHLGQVGDRCESCHQTASFRVALYVHRNRSLGGFFVGRHARAACDRCHKPATATFPKGSGTAVVFTADTRCVACHTDVHRGSLGRNCGTCHRP